MQAKDKSNEALPTFILALLEHSLGVVEDHVIQSLVGWTPTVEGKGHPRGLLDDRLGGPIQLNGNTSSIYAEKGLTSD